MNPIVYRPTFKDVTYCIKVAQFRDDINRKLEWEKGKHKNFSILNHFIGAYGELAVSRIFGIEWEGAMLDMLDYQEWRKVKPDLGIFEVKTVGSANGCLKLSENDKDWATAILMVAPDSWRIGVAALTLGKGVGLQPIYLAGHLPVKTGKEIGEQQVHKEKTTYVIKRDKLRPAEELRKVMSGFDKIRKERQMMRSNGIEFKLTKWVI